MTRLSLTVHIFIICETVFSASIDVKPKPGMLKRAAEKYNISADRSWMIGDKHTDIMAGKAFGARTIQIQSGKNLSSRDNNESNSDPTQSDFFVHSLLEATEIILNNKKIMH